LDVFQFRYIAALKLQTIGNERFDRHRDADIRIKGLRALAQ